uniref:C2H2-type domain-containing protein n=1 Tax=Timema shepardi TaxID=629360 RepID=A0A7R9AXM9_TIMSH|nr:unnamed protein product [Timema shepardi]
MKKRYGNCSDFPFVPVKEELDEPPGPCRQPSGESGNNSQILDNNVKSEEEDEDTIIYPAYLCCSNLSPDSPNSSAVSDHNWKLEQTSSAKCKNSNFISQSDEPTKSKCVKDDYNFYYNQHNFQFASDSKNKIQETTKFTIKSTPKSLKSILTTSKKNNKKKLKPPATPECKRKRGRPRKIKTENKSNEDKSSSKGSGNKIRPTFKTLRKNICLLDFIHVCPQCGLEFSTKDELNHHKVIHYRDKYCLCDRCGIFVFNSRLSQHMLVHTGQKPYSCPICGRGFTQSNSLKEHRVVHNRERHYTCEVCGQQFLRRGNLRDHKKVHFKERVFYCHICERRFTDRRALRKHNFTHTGEKPFSCDTCERKFASQSHLRRHSLTHNNQWRFQCDYCSYTFIQKGTYSGR